MASNNETVADIANEMRSEWAQVYFSEGSRRKDGEYCANEFVAIEPETVADRIEAAHRREVAELRKGISELLDALQAIYDEECTSYGTGGVYDKWRKVLKGASND